MPRTWETYRGSVTRTGHESPQITIQSGGHILMNQSAYGELGQPKVVSLMFDRESQAIGLKAAEEGEPFAYKVRERGHARVVAAKGFIRHYEIDDHLVGEAVMEEGVLVLELGKAVQIASRTRPSTAQTGGG